MSSLPTLALPGVARSANFPALLARLRDAWGRARSARELARLSPRERERFLADTWAERRQ